MKNNKKYISPIKNSGINTRTNTQREIAQITYNGDNVTNTLDVTSLFNKDYVPSYLTRTKLDLANNTRLAISGTIQNIANHLHTRIGNANILDTINLLTINSHQIQLFKPLELLKLQQRAFTIMLNFRIFFIVSKSLILLEQNNSPILQKHYQELYKQFLTKHNSQCFYTSGDNTQALEVTQKLLSTLMGFMYHFINISLKMLTITLDNKYPKLKETLSFDNFSSFLFNSSNTSFSRENTKIKVLSTDLDFLGYFMYEPFTPKFLSQNTIQLNTLKRLKSTLTMLFKIYYYYCMVQAPLQLKSTLNDLFPLEGNTTKIKLNFSDLYSIYTLETFSKNKFVSITQLLTNITFELTLFLSLNLDYDLFTSQKFNSIEINSIKDFLKKREITRKNAILNSVNSITNDRDNKEQTPLAQEDSTLTSESSNSENNFSLTPEVETSDVKKS